MAWPSIERALVEWAKANTALTAEVAGRVATRLPENPTFPFIVVRRIGGPQDSSDAPIDLPYVQWSVYASKGDTGPDWMTAEDTKLVLIEQVFTEIGIETAHGFIYAMTLVGSRQVEEPRTGWAHYAIDHLAMIR